MGKKITDDVIEKINEMYLECGVKKRVAEALGISPATVSKYIIPDYKIKVSKPIENFTKAPQGSGNLLNFIEVNSDIPAAKAFAIFCNLTNEEWEDLRELQKEILI